MLRAFGWRRRLLGSVVLVLGVSPAPAAMAGPTEGVLLHRNVALLFAPAPELPSRPLPHIEPVQPLPPTVSTDLKDHDKLPTYDLALYASFATLQMLDAHSTTRALAADYREGNAIMAGIAGNKAALFAVKGAAAAATIAVAYKLSRKRPMLATCLMVALNSVSAVVVAHNYRATGRR